MKNIILTLIIGLLSIQGMLAQNTKSETQAVLDSIEKANKAEWDFLYTRNLPEIKVTARHFKNDLDEYKFNDLKKRIIKVYPFVVKGREILALINENKENEKKRVHKKFLKKQEEVYKEEYEQRLRNLSVADGQVLVKLFARETNMSIYSLIKELKGPFVATFYKGVGKQYGYDLKEQYDPAQNQDMEIVMTDLEESGELLKMQGNVSTIQSVPNPNYKP